MDCIFCRIANGEIPTKIITETNHSIAFLDAFPLTKGHTLIIPKKHHEKIQNMSSEENIDLFSTVHSVISKVDKLTGATLMAVHNGKEAGQEIPHVHVHLVPRSPNDTGGPIHCLFDSTLNVSDSEINEILQKLQD
ncbi:MAG: HIT family protein [Nitrosopumilaceae archaeon]|uniref:HIT family protein n=2 Tax=Candidatus Nitrosomaritimum aestuariumsis TaxID=3342354 RepID=A0AC60W070_9ARCH|nr:HIT family protein [Nitrosopumilaceae archaeon]MBA4460252.1 HIT family protein [Nitrosopumilaceae archaeon]MBA4462237.1 HIT family protein [Nitrosopumilaceae archaeon]MBA4462569.1 HIT family protein [Nitrosopumilaceae archaeon]